MIDISEGYRLRHRPAEMKMRTSTPIISIISENCRRELLDQSEVEIRSEVRCVRTTLEREVVQMAGLCWRTRVRTKVQVRLSDA